MNSFDLEQNSNDWHLHRRKYINASEVSIIMGLNPFESKKNFFKRKLFDEKIEDNLFMRYGRNLESKARDFFNDINKTEFKPLVFVKEFFSASLDGWNKKTNSLLEIKCPFYLNSNTWKDFFMNDKIPIYYYAQIQAQIYCSNAEKAFFLVFQNYQNAKIKVILRDKSFIDRMYNECLEFYNLFIKARKILDKISE
ncbi:MAG: YqaJ viral recombinase family protein [Candidatus Phytoplasma stylosanthis]|uniref:lambda-exonuclease family protein n=1 Tax=Candidatus Phytoplasma stylosanthis TaxID=2798314 RepID=UPI00293B1625|nr:YqaJ viral recombinase family protein [Candidatus Phytoplasma stylosanthis]MDV3167831.1 YqaJ viral recombinase family protein [Candidatus Phytoplasma stylosanthis]MDV3170893.1 YqaJ viral recombinase family protein [Candidatus Phytoplasma stylosanthis]MDV3173705.1 YqaJ viral recombinase family protein [Candidatus Phytoplasma stylosanthis]MDV3174073.1 YqaJ viral recombinase family protein [Candidatus Phytoplasma stylosanthis]MDV3202415.1 YqaJ viral recombinase family protein [Candidatus Phyto